MTLRSGRRTCGGAWPSPISSDQVGRVRRLRVVGVGSDGSVWWEEARPAEGGRVCLMRYGHGRTTEMFAAELAGLGFDGGPGRSLLLDSGLEQATVVVAGEHGHRLHLLGRGDSSAPLTPENADADDYTDLVAGPGGSEVWCVRSRVTQGVRRHAIVAVPLDGNDLRVLVDTTALVSTPRPSPKGELLAWLTWDPPRMPWDGSRLRVGRITPEGVVDERTVLGGDVEAVFQPEWADSDTLYAVSDRSRWSNLYEVRLDGSIRPLCIAPEEFGWPQSQPGLSTYGILADGRLAVLHGCGDWRLDLLDPSDGTLTPVDGPYTLWQPGLRSHGSTIAATAASPTRPAEVVLVDAGTGRHRVVRESVTEVPTACLPRGEQTAFHARDGHVVHSVVYPPRNPEIDAVPGERVPYVIVVPDGPGAQPEPGTELVRAFFTSRGLGVAEVYCRGSSGFGRSYREQVYGRWGVADVEDCAVVGRGLVTDWNADPEGLVVRGHGAGGTTALGVLANTDLCAAASVHAAIVDVGQLRDERPDGFADYLHAIAADSTLLRGSVWLGRVRRPLLLVHGIDDTLVPIDQTVSAREAFWRHHLPNAFLALADEGHELRHSEATSRVLAAELAFYGEILGFASPDAEPLAVPRRVTRPVPHPRGGSDEPTAAEVPHRRPRPTL